MTDLFFDVHGELLRRVGDAEIIQHDDEDDKADQVAIAIYSAAKPPNFCKVFMFFSFYC